MTEPYSQDLRNRHEHRNREGAAQLLPLNQTFRLVHAPQSIEVSYRGCIVRELFLSSSFRQTFDQATMEAKELSGIC